MTLDELMAIRARLKSEPAPEYVFDENGLGAKALSKMKLPQPLWEAQHDDINDDIPF